MTSEQAGAIPPCPFCICQLHCSTDTGPNCPDPDLPYYAYRINCDPPPGMYCVCLGEGDFVGCCRKGL
jgi:hypothetical protein